MIARSGALLRRLLTLAALLGLALLAAAFWQAQQPPVVVRYTVPLAGLHRPLTIGQISDVHAGWDMPASRIAAAVDLLNRQRPDLILLTGDYVSGDPSAWSLAETRAALAPLLGLRAPLGVYAVTGNHDDPGKLRRLLAGTRIRFLHDDVADIGPLWLVGAREFKEPHRPVQTLRWLVARLPRAKPVVVVAHRPSFFNWADPPWGLMVAGHSHGGQIHVPGVTEWLIGRFLDPYLATHLRGLYRRGHQSLVVSSGLGTTGLPLRWGVPPEVVVIRLVPAAMPLAYSVGRNSGTDR